MADSPTMTQDAPTAPKPPKPKPTARPKPAKPSVDVLPPFNVVLLDDDHHSYEYVVEMLKSVFGHPDARGFRMAKEVDETGRVVVHTTHKELAELKRDQIHAYGTDKRIAACKGSMTATVEPAN